MGELAFSSGDKTAVARDINMRVLPACRSLRRWPVPTRTEAKMDKRQIRAPTALLPCSSTYQPNESEMAASSPHRQRRGL